MVYVKQILLRNFKSFGGMVRINLSPGFTVITGPNGSGKSNVLDAFQFVFGELGTRKMRVASFSSLVYDGGQSGENGDFAQVIIRLDNSDGRIPIDEKVISIGRRVDKEGRSRYLLNSKPVSRKTIINVLSMVGISSEGYNIVLQGTATRLSDITPAERMDAIESLIGIREYDEKKEEAERRLKDADLKVQVASARIDEVRKRLVSLERERNDALRYQFLKEEERRLNIGRLSYELLKVQKELSGLDQQVKDNAEALQNLETENQKLSSDEERIRAELEVHNQEVSDKGNTRLPLIKSELVRQKELINGLNRRLEDIKREKAALEKQMENGKRELERLEEEGVDIRAGIERISKEFLLAKSELEQKESARLAVYEQISLWREEIGQSQKKIEELQDKLRSVEGTLEGLEIEINKHMLAHETLKERHEDFSSKRVDSLKIVENLKATLREFDEQKKLEEKKVEGFLRDLNERLGRQRLLRKRVEEAGSLASDVEKTVTEFTAKRDLWKRIALEEKALERIEEMGSSGAIGDYHGILRDLIRTEPRYRRAVATSSNGWLNAVIVENLSSTLQCIKSLKKSELGMVRILPLQEMKPSKSPDKISDEGTLCLLSDVITCDEKLSSVVRHIWGDTFVVKDAENGIRISNNGYRAVTLSGDVYEANGGVLGGHYRSAPEFSKLVPSEDSVVNLSKTIKSLRGHLNNRMKDLKFSGEDLKKLSQYVGDATKSVENIGGNLVQVIESIKRAEKSTGQIDKKVQDIQVELGKENGLITSLKDRKEVVLQEATRLKEEISQLEAKRPSDIASLETRAARANPEIETLRTRIEDFDKELMRLRERLERIIEPRATELNGKLLSTSESDKTLNAESEKTRTELLEAEETMKQLNEEKGALTEAVESTSKVQRFHQERISAIESERRKLEKRVKSLEQEKISLTLAAERRRMQGEQLIIELRSLGQQSIAVLDENPQEIEKRLKVIGSEKEAFGAINQLADRQYSEQVASYKQLSIRINELENERASILKFIGDIDKEKLAHFMKSFNEICENFTEYFSKLTGGGEGRLEFQNPKDPFSAGIDLFVQFPGKPMRLVSGHSGGERSVAAIAYLLAIQRFLKAPFYLFDEIDAHLDDFNVDRLAEVLRDNSSQVQFIVITLKDAMISLAENVQGCFNRAGKSRIISLPRLLVTH